MLDILLFQAYFQILFPLWITCGKVTVSLFFGCWLDLLDHRVYDVPVAIVPTQKDRTMNDFQNAFFTASNVSIKRGLMPREIEFNCLEFDPNFTADGKVVVSWDGYGDIHDEVLYDWQVFDLDGEEVSWLDLTKEQLDSLWSHASESTRDDVPRRQDRIDDVREEWEEHQAECKRQDV